MARPGQRSHPIGSAVSRAAPRAIPGRGAPRSTLSRWRSDSMSVTERAVRRRAWPATCAGLVARGIDARAIDLPLKKAEEAVPAFRAIVPDGPDCAGRRRAARSPWAASRTAAGSRASPPPSPTRTTPRSSCSASRSIRRERRARPRSGPPIFRRSAAPSCSSRGSRIRSPGSTCCGRRIDLLARRRAGDLPAPRPHPEARSRGRPRSRGERSSSARAEGAPAAGAAVRLQCPRLDRARMLGGTPGAVAVGRTRGRIEDVAAGEPTPAAHAHRPPGACVPLRPALVRPSLGALTVPSR